MPRAPSRCSLTCPNPIWKYGKCKDHQPEKIPWAGSKRDSAFRHSFEWERQRRRVLKRDKYTCQLCGASDSHHVDHIIPVWYSGKEQVEDYELQTLCEKCHTAKSSFEGVQAKRIKKANGIL